MYKPVLFFPSSLDFRNLSLRESMETDTNDIVRKREKKTEKNCYDTSKMLFVCCG